MPTFEVDDQLHAHPKVDVAGYEAMGLWVVAGSWCAAYLTDGFVPRGRAEKLGPLSLWDKLVKAQLVAAIDDGYQFHDWDHWNRTAAQVAEQRAKSTAKKRDQRARKRALAKCPPRRPQGTGEGTGEGTTPKTDQGSPATPRARVSPSPSDPPVVPQGDTHTNLLGEPEPESRRTRRKPETPLPEDWRPNDKHKAKANEIGLNLAFQADRFRGKALEKDRRCRNWDAAFTNWLKSPYAKKDDPGPDVTHSPLPDLVPYDEPTAEDLDAGIAAARLVLNG